MVAITTPLVTNSGVTDIFIAENRYALITTGSGIDVLDLFSQQIISSGTLGPGTGETSCVAADTETTFGQMYVGTTASGVFSMRYMQVRGGYPDFSDLLVQRFYQDSTPPLTGNLINDLAVVPDRLFISTSGGVDFITNEELGASRTLISGSEDCQLTAAGEAYWSVVASGVEVNYDLFPSSGTGIINVDFTYSSVTNPALSNKNVNDIAVEVGLPNLLGFSTLSGVLIVEEVQGAESSSNTKTFIPDNPVSVDFSPNATFTSGLVFIADFRSLTTIGLVDDTVSGTHFHTPVLADAEFNTGEQALITGTVSIVRTTNVP